MVVGGAALARGADGRIVFVHGGLPDETVDVEVRSVKKDFAVADVVAVVEASPDRVEPPCEAWHRGCGGCDWQHIDPAAQLRLKVAIVREALTRTGRLVDPVVTSGGSVSPWGYRTTIRVADAGGGRVGFRSRRSHAVVPVDQCPVAAPSLNAMLSKAHADRDGDLMLRVSLACGPGNGAIEEVVDGRRLRVSAPSFFQSSPEAAELLVDAVREAAAGVTMEDATVIDAYGGVGLFAATVAAGARHVIVVESSPSACADARVNLQGRSAEVIETRMENWTPVRADLVVADPARNGLERDGVARVVATGAPVIVLVSCDAGSVARDARLLTEQGYAHDGTAVIDVFPNTSHIEAVTRFVLDRVP